MDLFYAFIKDNRVTNIALFAEQNDELADSIAIDLGYDDAIWVGENSPSKYAFYDGKTFTPATTEYLISIGIIADEAQTL